MTPALIALAAALVAIGGPSVPAYFLIRYVAHVCLGIHNWSRWGDPGQIETVHFAPDGVTIIGTRKVTVQKRECARCGIVEHKRVKVPT